jgi:thiamine-monophosphate kinase
LVGAGDDAALLENISRPVISTDAQHEDIHFRRCWQSFSEIGYKAAETAFSDLAASYAQPLAMFVNLSLPKSISEEDVVEIYKGINHSLASRRAVLAGGNVASARSLAIDLFVIGRAESDLFPLRSAAKPGYGIYATGPLGLARAGLDCLIRGDKQFPALVEAFKKPKARFDAARILADHRVKCTMDISDGLAGDVRHMAMASHVTAAMDLSRVPVDLSLDMFCRKYKALPREIMAAGGEDYELLFACPKEVFEELKQKLPEAFSVGICLPYSGVPVTGLPEGIRGFDHALIKIRQEVNQ